MVRRRFIGILGLLSAGGAASIKSVAGSLASASTSSYGAVTFEVHGFTCITCAIGLETLLRREKGVLSAKADYQSAMATIEYDPAAVGEAGLQAIIQDAGFRAIRVHD